MRHVLVLAGPTATGKSELAVLVCERLGGEIISADSRQAYRGLSVGTAAPTADQLRRVPHHGVGFLNWNERYGAGRFADLAADWISDIRGRGKVAVITGGTGFFLRTVWEPLFGGPELDPERRRSLERVLGGLTPDRLAAWARRLDPELAGRLTHVDPQRAQRAIEVATLTGRPLSRWQAEASGAAAPAALAAGAPVFVLELEAEEHRSRIRHRAERLLDGAWIEEVRALLDGGADPSDPAFSSLGYRDVMAVASGDLGRDEALDRIFRDTWQYARRQRTWCRHQLPEGAIRLDAALPSGELADRIVTDHSGMSAESTT